jgi:hypothetical protein
MDEDVAGLCLEISMKVTGNSMMILSWTLPRTRTTKSGGDGRRLCLMTTSSWLMEKVNEEMRVLPLEGTERSRWGD